MRTKTLLIAAAALAVGIIAPKAQTVYSQNVVGYTTLSLTNGFTMVGNQLDLDGTGTNNTLQSVFSTNLPNLTKVFFYSAINGWQNVQWLTSSGGHWTGNALTNTANAALNPGHGVMVQIPTSLAATNILVPLVGQVLQGAFTNAITAGFQIVSCQIPLSGSLDTNLFYAPTRLDRVYTWNPGLQNYNGVAPQFLGTSWSGGAGAPALQVNQPIFLNAKSNTVWGVNFTVQ
jgi:hypothetical protein